MEGGPRQAIERELYYLRTCASRLGEYQDEMEGLEQVMTERGIPVPDAGSAPWFTRDELSERIEATSEDIEQMERIREEIEELERALQTHIERLRFALSARR